MAVSVSKVSKGGLSLAILGRMFGVADPTIRAWSKRPYFPAEVAADVRGIRVGASRWHNTPVTSYDSSDVANWILDNGKLHFCSRPEEVSLAATRR